MIDRGDLQPAKVVVRLCRSHSDTAWHGDGWLGMRVGGDSDSRDRVVTRRLLVICVRVNKCHFTLDTCESHFAWN